MDERALIEAHLAKKGVRKFESGATGDLGHLLDWLQRVCNRKTRRHSTAAGNRKLYEIDGKRYDPEGLIEVVNLERKKRKLQPITLAGLA